MILLARQNADAAAISNIEFLLGSMEAIPLPDDSVDVIISNCVINLAADKHVVLLEAYRVLKKGGKLAVSDIVLRKEFPELVRRNVELWLACIAGALTMEEYKNEVQDAGFSMVSIEEVKVYSESDV